MGYNRTVGLEGCMGDDEKRDNCGRFRESWTQYGLGEGGLRRLKR